MAITMFVNNIPNGTSIEVRKGTAIHLTKKLIETRRIAEDGTVDFDYLRVSQLAGAMGVSPEEAREVCVGIVKGEGTVEESIGKYMEEAQLIKNEMLDSMQKALKR